MRQQPIHPVLYGHFASGNCYKAALMLTLCGYYYRYEHVDYLDGATHTEPYRSLNQLEELPLLLINGRPVRQSANILRTLSEQSGQFGDADSDRRRQIDELLFWDSGRLSPAIGLCRFQIRFAEGSREMIDFFSKRATDALGVLNRLLDRGPYLVGSEPTIADIACSAYPLIADEAEIDIADFGNVAAWLDRIRALPHWQPQSHLMPRQSGSYPPGRVS